MIKPKLSIIVPVYNVEKYVGDCFKSLISQNIDRKYFEIIFVIDGSRDNSENIIRNMITENPFLCTNISVLNKENGGLSSARNFGVQHSIGDYIWFVDSDDWIESDSVQSILTVIKEYQPEIIAQTQYFQENNVTKHIIRYNKRGIIAGPEFCGKDHSTAAQFYVVQRSFWSRNNFHFREGMLHEDGELTPRLLYMAESIYVLTKPLYHILVRQGSITHTVNPKRCYDYMIVLDTLLNFYNNINPCHRYSFSYLMSDHIIGIMNLALQVDNKTQCDVNAYLVKNRSFTNILFHSKKVSLILFALLLRIFPKKPLKVYQFLKFIRS